MRKVPYSLIWLDYLLRKNGICGKVHSYELSQDKTTLKLGYFNNLLETKYIYIFRTSRLCYRIHFEGKLYSAKTHKAAAQLLDELLKPIIEKLFYLKSISAYDYITLELNTHSDKLNLNRKAWNKNREV